MDVQIGDRTLELVEGDITEMETDAIVNAANDRLVLGGGVAGAIRRKGGPQIQAECDRIGGTFVGGAVLTTGGRLKARYVIHAVGPRMGEGNEDEKLRNATLNSLKLADEHGLKSLAFPAISAGIFGFPIQRCENGIAPGMMVPPPDGSRQPWTSSAPCLRGSTNRGISRKL